MKRLLKKIDDVMVAITFAEAGELEEAEALVMDAEPDAAPTEPRDFDPTLEAA